MTIANDRPPLLAVGSSWLPKLPTGWRRERLDHIASVSARIGWKALTADEYVSNGFVFLSTPNIKGEFIDFVDVNYISEYRYVESPELQLSVGDVLLAKDGNTLGIVNLVTELPRPATVNGSIAVIRPLDVEPAFLRYYIASQTIQSLIDALKGGMGVPHLFQFDLNRFPVSLPPPWVQRGIVNYLDRETTRIDALIAAKRRMLNLLEERWVATVTHTTAPRWATDRILNEVVREVPDGWSIRKLGSMTRPEASIAYGILLPGERLTEGVPYLGAGDVRPDRLRLELLPRTRPEIAAAYPRTVMRSGELVYAIRGSFGAVEQVPPEMHGVNLSRDAARISPGEGINARWLMYALKSELAQEQFRRREVGATITGVNIEDLKSVRLAVPPSEDQSNQAARLDGLRGSFDATDLALNRQLDLLIEHRQALITAAVTGQVDIPEAS